MWRRLWWLSALGLVALRCGGGSGDDTGTGGSGGTAGVSTCGAAMTACSSDSQCCDRCDPMTHVCTTNLPTPNTCIQAGSACGSSTACCSLACDNGTCKDKCVGDNDACTSSGACCSGKCADGKCAQINLACKTAGNACGSSGECCSKACTNGTCALSVSWCIQNGDICANPDDCCGGMCNATEGGTLGTCAQPVVGGTYCSSGIDGTVCSGCNECCSRLCAPYGPTGVKVCQPASGCHVNGDLCRKNSDCCGGEGSGLPGDGNVTCVLMEGTSKATCAITKITPAASPLRVTTVARRSATPACVRSTPSASLVATGSARIVACPAKHALRRLTAVTACRAYRTPPVNSSAPRRRMPGRCAATRVRAARSMETAAPASCA